ncbi:MAG: M20/M25/M40 family metallo-hydrolase [Candidatus Aminicenantes bacterium]|nr:M20/M25/M40 family metallo-hydrolase [Candidatus Aminicenantes bacterium]
MLSNKTDLLKYWFCVLLIFSALPGMAEDKTDPLASITMADLRDHIFFLASDALEGRLMGEKGYDIAAAYAASQFSGAGLMGIIEVSQDHSSFLHSVKMISGSLGADTVMHINTEKTTETLTLGDDFLIQKKDFIGFDVEGTPVFVGYGIEEPAYGWNDYENLAVSGKIVIAYAGAPLKDGSAVLPEDLHTLYSDISQSINQRILYALRNKASTLLLILDTETAKNWEGRVDFPQRGFVSSGHESKPLSFQIYVLRPEAAVFLLDGTGFDPLTGEGEFKNSILKNIHIKLQTDREITREMNSNNVIGLVAGNDPVLKDEYIVISAHLDHLGVRDGNVFNGADDNASGCAAVLEVAEALAMSSPKRSVLFVLFTGEEGGAFGSRQFVADPPVSIDKIVLNINADMVGRNSEPFPNSLLAISSENKRSQLNTFIIRANETIENVHIDMEKSSSSPWTDFLYGSDQFCFINEGIPAILITRGFMQPDYHQASDDAETINYEKVLQAAKLMYALALEAANRTTLFN